VVRNGGLYRGVGLGAKPSLGPFDAGGDAEVALAVFLGFGLRDGGGDGGGFDFWRG
jgi:hypothetical protein